MPILGHHHHCIRYEGAINGHSYGMSSSGKAFGDPAPVGTGIHVDAAIAPVHGASPPGVVGGNTFASVGRAIDLGGGSYPILMVAGGNRAL